VWWCIPVILAVGRWKNCEFEASLGYKVRLCLKKKIKMYSTICSSKLHEVKKIKTEKSENKIKMSELSLNIPTIIVNIN
jgi:hypothetical protein